MTWFLTLSYIYSSVVSEVCSFIVPRDEEGEEEVRRRERDLGIVPTSPASLLSHLQINSPPPSNIPVGSLGNNGPQPPMTGLSPGIRMTFLLPRDSGVQSVTPSNKRFVCVLVCYFSKGDVQSEM